MVHVSKAFYLYVKVRLSLLRFGTEQNEGRHGWYMSINKYAEQWLYPGVCVHNIFMMSASSQFAPVYCRCSFAMQIIYFYLFFQFFVLNNLETRKQICDSHPPIWEQMLMPAVAHRQAHARHLSSNNKYLIRDVFSRMPNICQCLLCICNDIWKKTTSTRQRTVLVACIEGVYFRFVFHTEPDPRNFSLYTLLLHAVFLLIPVECVSIRLFAWIYAWFYLPCSHYSSVPTYGVSACVVRQNRPPKNRMMHAYELHCMCTLCAATHCAPVYYMNFNGSFEINKYQNKGYIMQ